MTKSNYICIPANHGQVQPTKWAIILIFYSYSGGGLSFLRSVRWFVYFSPPIVPNSGVKLWWFALVCGRFQWFVMVCSGLSSSHTDDTPCMLVL